MKRALDGSTARRGLAIATTVATCALAAAGWAGCSPDTESAAAKAASELVGHGTSVLFGSLPKLKTAAKIQENTLRADVKSATCGWLAKYVTSGEEPPSAVFFNSLEEGLRASGGPGQNELNAIDGEFTKLSNTLSGKMDAEDAAKQLACSFLPG